MPQERLSGRELMEQHPRRWTPLNEALPPHEAKQFAWKQESGTMRSYQHMQTGKHIHIDGQAGRFYNQNREPISARQALDSAMPEGAKHSHARDLPERNIEQQGFGLGL